MPGDIRPREGLFVLPKRDLAASFTSVGGAVYFSFPSLRIPLIDFLVFFHNIAISQRRKQRAQNAVGIPMRAFGVAVLLLGLQLLNRFFARHGFPVSLICLIFAPCSLT